MIDAGLVFAVDAESRDSLAECAVAGDEAAGIAEGAEILRWIEAEAGDVRARANWFSARVDRADRLRRVFNDREIMLGAIGLEGAEFADLAKEVRGHDGTQIRDALGAANRIFGIHVQCQRVDIDEDRRGAHANDRRGGREKRVGGAEHSIACADA